MKSFISILCLVINLSYNIVWGFDLQALQKDINEEQIIYSNNKSSLSAKDKDHIESVYNMIDKFYVGEIDKQKILDAAINGMLQSLDPYSHHQVDDDLKFFTDSTQGEFGGVGIEIMFKYGLVKVISAIDGLPAGQAGIKSGDYIIAVDGELVSNLGFTNAVRKMRGEAGTKVSLVVMNEERDKPKEFELVRQLVELNPVKYEVESDDLGCLAYIKVPSFNSKSSSQLKSAVDKIQAQAKNENKKLYGIVLDLRNNPGGLLDQALEMCEYFIESGTILKIKNKFAEHEKVASTLVAKAPDTEMVVLINQGSASASEIVTGALKDRKKAIIMGTRSFGKGLIQTLTQVNNRSAIQLTTAEYCTPSDHCINEKGIEPDIKVEQIKLNNKREDNLFSLGNNITYLDKNNKLQVLHNKKNEKKKAEIKDEYKLSDRYYNDYQYSRAYDVIRGIVLTKSE